MESMTPEEIKAIRIALGDTQEEFGDRIGVTANTVARWERGERKPLPSALHSLRALKKQLSRKGVLA